MNGGLTWFLIFLDGQLQINTCYLVNQKIGLISSQELEQSFKSATELAQWICSGPYLWAEGQSSDKSLPFRAHYHFQGYF